MKNPAADDREYCVLHVDDSKLFLYGNAKYKCDMFAVSALRLNSGAEWSAGRRADCPDWIAAISPGCGCVSWLR